MIVAIVVLLALIVVLQAAMLLHVRAGMYLQRSDMSSNQGLRRTLRDKAERLVRLKVRP